MTQLSPTEQKILEVIKSGSGRPVSPDEILARVHGGPSPHLKRAPKAAQRAMVYVNVSRLKRKVGTHKISYLLGDNSGYVWMDDTSHGI